MYDIERNEFFVSRDVVFDETTYSYDTQETENPRLVTRTPNLAVLLELLKFIEDRGNEIMSHVAAKDALIVEEVLV